MREALRTLDVIHNSIFGNILWEPYQILQCYL